MYRLLILIFVFNFSIVNSAENYKSANCKWDNRSNIPCIEILKSIPNSSNLSISGINKITITKKQIDEIGAVDIIDVLNTIPDINITQSGPKGQQASMFLRGTNSNHTLVMINGIPINDQSTTQGLHDFGVDFIQTVQQIEVFPGSSATHFGSNAIGGAINIIMTGDFKDNISISGENISNYELSANKTITKDESNLNFKIGNVRSKKISAKGNSNDEVDGVVNYTTNINYEKFLKNNFRFHNTVYLRKTKSEYDNSTSNQTDYSGDNRMGLFQFGLEKLDRNKKQNYNFFYNIYDREYDERSIIDKYESEVIGVNYDYSKLINENISLGFGSQYNYNWGHFDNKGSYQASTKGHFDNLAFYSNIGLNIFDKSNISLFARSDNHKQTGYNETYKINFEQIFEKFNLGLSAMTGLRNPTLYEMYGTDNFGYSGNRDLMPEKSNTYELYSNFEINNNFKFSIRGFQSTIKNNIEYINNKYQNDNDDVDLKQNGINTNFKIKINDNSINLFSSILDTKKENGSDQLRRPRKTYGINFSKKINDFNFGNYLFNLSYNHYGKHYDTHSSTFSLIEMDSTDLVDLKISKLINEGTHYFIKINNVFDETYQRPHGYNQEKRNIKFGVKF